MEKLNKKETRKVNGGGTCHRLFIYKQHAEVKGYVAEKHIPRWPRNILILVRRVY